MQSFKTYLLALGIPGLLLIAFLDSAGVPLPGGVDLVVMLLSWQRPTQFIGIALTAAVGSTLGCLVLYRIARTGGDAMMARFSPAKQEWVRNKVRQNDTLAVMVAMLGPPPFPTKLFILVAGMVQMDWKRFVTAVFIGRLVRFTAEAYLAVRLGGQALETIEQHYPTIGIALVIAVVLVLAVRYFAGKRAPA
jgi:membrane protein YqaA with SNARE-associated domain